jgi:hypothetical protein
LGGSRSTKAKGKNMNSDFEYWERMKINAIQNNMPRVHGFWSGVIAAQHSMHLTALRRGLALSLLFNVILLVVLLVSIGGK